ncbi:UNVERIFIED_CONTAM: Methylecgonone reductase [Sesamum radiatum]|uniref:Methylecgonone reductase n=1 Tax=Sesamum radiatum TaxID=300843 RepID=A0AAW2WIW5_SESRA
MDKVRIPEVVLNSGHKMPAIGLGTAGSKLPLAEQLPLLVEAIAAGYRHFDTATLYGTEEIVGQAVAEALGRGLIKSREELFITTKLWCTDAEHDLVLPALNESLRKLGLQYVDLYLIHWPIKIQKDDSNSIKTMHFDIKGTWEGMEECCRRGLAKSIGVSNYSCAKLSTLLENATIPPAVNQVVLRWILQQGGIPIVRSFNKERMKQNLQIFDWELTDEEVGKIQQIPQQRACNPTDLVGPHAQYKSLEELWDGEI